MCDKKSEGEKQVVRSVFPSKDNVVSSVAYVKSDDERETETHTEKKKQSETERHGERSLK